MADEILIYATGERFRWEATDRTTGTVYREDVNGLGSFNSLNRGNLASVRLFQPVQGGEMCAEILIPEGAEAVFVRRRTIQLDLAEARDTSMRLGYTIVGFRWPDGIGSYHFFNDLTNDVFASTDFNAV